MPAGRRCSEYLRWIHPNENHNFRENFEKQLFSQIYIMAHLYYPKFLEESEYRIHFDQKLTQHLLYSFFWALVFEKFVKTSRKFFSNTFIVLSLEFELLFTLFPFPFIFSVNQQTNLQQQSFRVVCCCTNHRSTTD